MNTIEVKNNTFSPQPQASYRRNLSVDVSFWWALGALFGVKVPVTVMVETFEGGAAPSIEVTRYYLGPDSDRKFPDGWIFIPINGEKK